MLGMSREQVWRLFSSGRLPGYRFDRLLRFAPGDVEHFKTEHYQRTGTPSPSPGKRWDSNTGSRSCALGVAGRVPPNLGNGNGNGLGFRWRGARIPDPVTISTLGVGLTPPSQPKRDRGQAHPQS